MSQRLKLTLINLLDQVNLYSQCECDIRNVRKGYYYCIFIGWLNTRTGFSRFCWMIFSVWFKIRLEFIGTKSWRRKITKGH